MRKKIKTRGKHFADHVKLCLLLGGGRDTRVGTEARAGDGG